MPSTAPLDVRISAHTIGWNADDHARAWRRLSRLALEPHRKPRARWPWLVVLAFVLGVITGAKAFAAEPVKFIQPRAPIVSSGPYGTVIPVQLRIEPNPANRGYAITWCDGAHGHSLDGADDAAVQPLERPLQVRVGPGDCEFVASVLGAGGAVRARTSFVMHVCGGQDDCIRGGDR